MQYETGSRLPAAEWVWQGLRRNPSYRRAYRANIGTRPCRTLLSSGATLLRARKRWSDAETFGLLCFADPDKASVDTDLIWRPDLLAGSLRVSLAYQDPKDESAPPDHDEIVLSSLNTKRMLLDTVDGTRHIVLSGRRFWVQLYCDSQCVIGDQTAIKIRIDGASHGMRRLDTAAQLLALHRSTGDPLSLIGRRKSPQSVIRALGAYDIWHGFERPKGNLEEVAAFLCGDRRAAEGFETKDRNLRVQARRWVERGEAFVTSKYLELLTRKSI